MEQSLSKAYVSYQEDKTAYGGILGWIFSNDHKRIGILYLCAISLFLLVGASLGFLMRLEMLTMGETIVKPRTYNSLFTLHGVIMIFLIVLPSVPSILGNFFLPIQLGAKDVAFPRLNLFSWWLYMTGAVIAVAGLFVGGGAPDTGWTFYAPYTFSKSPTNIIFPLIGAFILGMSSILTALNFLTTIHRMRCPGMTWGRMPLFVWGIYATAWIQVLATPIVGITLLLVILEKVFGIGVFDPSKGGDPILYQHLFWIYSHPAVYIMILPGMGIISEILPTFTKKNIFGYTAIAYSSMFIAVLGSFVWAHHMFTSGMSDVARVIFSFLTFLVAIPTGVKIFNWLATLYQGSIDPKVPFLFSVIFIFQFCIGGFTGLLQGALSSDLHIHDTYYVVGHFHYTMFGGLGFALFGGMHYWFPKMFGKMYNELTAKIALLLLFIGFNTLYFTMLVMGWWGMPRRYYDYLAQFQTSHIVATVGSWFLVGGIFLMVGNLLWSAFKGAKASANPWGGTTLEWQIPSPPPTENFETIPVVTAGPYERIGDEK